MEQMPVDLVREPIQPLIGLTFHPAVCWAILFIKCIGVTNFSFDYSIMQQIALGNMVPISPFEYSDYIYIYIYI